jgi:uncharacterized membrane protein
MPAPTPSPAYVATVAAHAAAATVALAVGLVALTSAKGGRLHRRYGRGYARAIAAVVGTGAALMALGRATPYLATLLLLTAYPTWSGVRVLARRRPDADPAQRAGRADRAFAAGTLAAALALLGAAALGRGGPEADAIWGLAPFLVVFSAYDLWRFARPAAWPMAPDLWLREHIGKLTGAYFGAVSAYAGNVVTGVPDPWPVLAPNVAGVVVMAAFLVRVRRRRRPDAPAAGAAGAPSFAGAAS